MSFLYIQAVKYLQITKEKCCWNKITCVNINKEKKEYEIKVKIKKKTLLYRHLVVYIIQRNAIMKCLSRSRNYFALIKN